MKHAVLAVVVIVATAAPARADNDVRNVLFGPLIGLRLSGPSEGHHGVIGLEGGVGWGPERINLGFEHRDDLDLYYLEFDPWIWVGGSLGFGVDGAGQPHGIVGLWEGFPIAGAAAHGCPDGFGSLVTIAGGLRYAGALELYVTVKAGMSESVCF